MKRYFDGYWEAVATVAAQDLAGDLETIDMLFGRDLLAYGATPADVKAEALRRLEIEWSTQEWTRAHQPQAVPS